MLDAESPFGEAIRDQWQASGIVWRHGAAAYQVGSESKYGGHGSVTAEVGGQDYPEDGGSVPPSWGGGSGDQSSVCESPEPMKDGTYTVTASKPLVLRRFVIHS